MALPPVPETQIEAQAPVPLPRITICYCTQCKWMLRAAYFAQELLSTFGTALGEVALQPATGGIFTVDIHHPAEAVEGERRQIRSTRLWDRKADGGFPEVKELKRRVRDVVQPGRDLGHVDGTKAKKASEAAADDQDDNSHSTESNKEVKKNPDGTVCEDCN